MLTLEEIYNKYVTKDRIETDPILEKLKERSKTDKILEYYISQMIQEFNDPEVNCKGLRKLYKPGLPIVLIDSLNYYWNGDNSYGILSPVIENRMLNYDNIFGISSFIKSEIVETEEESFSDNVTNIITGETYTYILTKKVFSRLYYDVLYSDDRRLKNYYYKYMRTQKLYLYCLPSLRTIKNNLIVREVYMNDDNMFYDIKSKKAIITNCSYGVAFSEEMLKEQFEILKKVYLRSLTTEISQTENIIGKKQEQLELLTKKRDKLLDKLFFEEERLDNLLKI